MEQLGYSPEKLLATAQQVSAVWDMGDIDDKSASGIASEFAYSGNQTTLVTEEENAMEEDEDRACFPEFTSDIDAE
ncbi:hypothetical protein PC129_g15463 [Phytophthora cactorum]|nr:hypothetical protein Pcac1_g25118 [Phytophthora cactorum]KAG2827121.1 hypothetical protein PC112_g8971 [Phytophthora cactorum]KAG2850121.1 hypothetical protein PC113_g17061 [Phytophthora cactorum]KAG2888057.1 hypothetical protein PC114_g18549 [Phytophthora cactorum]KAG2899849.1 hypothetical protein PC115_g16413 [Phytophthora cactorum]